MLAKYSIFMFSDKISLQILLFKPEKYYFANAK